MDKSSKLNIKKALKKRALGYDSTEVTEEYQEKEDGSVKMIKRKVVSKNVPPDVTALKLFLDIENETDDIKNLTDDELQEEKIRLIKLLMEDKNGN